MKSMQILEMLGSTLKVYSRVSLERKPKMRLSNTSQKNIFLSFYSESEGKTKEAAVLVPLFYKNDSLHILLTKRAQKVEHHKGEISFPGGAKDIEDNSLEETALRETQEEVGILSSDIKILGILDDVFTLASHFLVTPYVGIIPYPYNFQSNFQEIEEILEIPFSFFLLEENYWEGSFSYKENTIPSYFFQWRKDIIIWGITGHIIKNLCNIVKNNLLITEPGCEFFLEKR
ncbi:MAG: CoA pyrophosphatase [Candidatus Brocadiae bacterium]|nr:CoA pyrophosphatase [Candidatus Brocadiia bacterium]